MAIDLRGEPEAPVWPAGIAVRSLDPERELDAFHAAVSESFAEHWGGPRTRERLRAAVEQEDFDPTLWFLAVDGREIAGTVECLRRGGSGYVRYLGVREPWRGRGLGRALLRHGLRELYGRGLRRVALGVDANNASGAVRLYEGEGMTVEIAAVTLEKELRPERAASSP
jgi:mycothiol synthase